MRTTFAVCSFLVTIAISGSSLYRVAGGELKLAVVEAASDRPLPCRVHLKDSGGRPQRAGDLPFWRDHFVCDGKVAIKLPPGKYTYEIERGPEYEVAAGSFVLGKSATLLKTVKLKRLVDMKREGWWSGELHVHRPQEEIELLMRAEDLHVAPVITWWNRRNLWAKRAPPKKLLVRFDGDRFYRLMAGEDEREGGALMFFNLQRPLGIAGATREYPSPMKYLLAAKRRGAWVDIEKPFWWDVPVWLASGKVDSIGIANNHMQRSKMYLSEAWGKPRDTKVFPNPLGNGQWTQHIYYHVLNCGLHIPPSAGSASGVLDNPVGYNRMYVHVDGEFNYEKWWRNFRAGRVTVTNGPLLRPRVNGELPGHVFQANAGEEIELDIAVDVASRDKLKRLEVIRNGEVVEVLRLNKMTNRKIKLPKLRFRQSGWFLIRAIADVPNTFRFGSTGPYYVEIGGKRRVSKRSAEFFLSWVKERMGRVKIDDAKRRKEVLHYHEQASRFWQEAVQNSNAS